MKLAASQDMKKIDELAVGQYGLKIEKLMDSAGASVAREALKILGKPRGRKIGVLCGKGHNGGDGLAAARALKRKKAKVVAVLASKPDEMVPETLAQFKKARSAKVRMIFCEGIGKWNDAHEALEGCAFLVDALLGTGLSRPVGGIYEELIRWAMESGKPVMAVDVPSGLSADSGEALGLALPARWTVTFGLPKIGFYTPRGETFVGEVKTVNIGFPAELLNSSFIRQELTESGSVVAALPKYGKAAHKGNRGRVLVVGGSAGLTGAACLSAWGALRIGAGLVTVGCPKSLNSILEVKLTEPMTAPLPEVEGGFLSSEALDPILELASVAKAVVLGPGLGRHEQTGRLVKSLLPRLTVPVVLDADALNLLGGDPEILRGVQGPVVLTPHPGEAARLLKTTILKIEANRVEVAKQLARDYNVVSVLKGRFTVLADPAGNVRVNPTGSRSLASGGTGDILSGIVGGLLAQGLSPFDAATVGVYVHGLAGEEGARKWGPDGVLAGDLLPLLPVLLKELREATESSNGRRL